ncbi:MAG: HD domain-containing protein [Chloroflexi bacterium]|nr:HD domain-containing protein [Chloroflexota bacterium]
MNIYEFRAWSEKSQVGICILQDGKFLLANPQFQRTTGYTEEELMDRERLALIVQNDRPLAGGAGLGAEISEPLEYRIIDKAGRVKWLRESLAPIEFEGMPVVLAYFLDVTEYRRAEQASKQSSEKLGRLLDATSEALALTLEMRDPYTAAHQRRVTKLACAIGKELCLPETQIETIRLAGLLHDVGKIHIPAEILSKPERLSENELSIMRSHPRVGYNILKRIDYPSPVAQAVLQHHERLDGSGYPFGLSSERILLEAKVLAVADVVEAMASHRPYRPALGIERGLEEISGRSGVAYDASAVNACVSLFDGSRFQFEQERSLTQQSSS